MGSTTEVQWYLGASWHSYECHQHGELVSVCEGQTKRQPPFGYKNGIFGTWQTDDPQPLDIIQVISVTLLSRTRHLALEVVHTNVWASSLFDSKQCCLERLLILTNVHDRHACCGSILTVKIAFTWRKSGLRLQMDLESAQ